MAQQVASLFQPDQRIRAVKRPSFVVPIDLTDTDLDKTTVGKLFAHAGYGLYLMHQSFWDTHLEVTFNKAPSLRVVFRRGTFHYPGGINEKNKPQDFTSFQVFRPSGAPSVGTAYFLILGSPEAQYDEDEGAVKPTYDGTADVAVADATDATILSSTPVASLRNATVYVTNSGGTIFGTGRVEISPDDSNWLVYDSNTLAGLEAGATERVTIPDDANFVRVIVQGGGGATTATVRLRGTL